MIEFGAINITGFRIVDVTRPHVKDFLAGWHRLDPAISQAGRESISVRIYMYIYIYVYIQHLSCETLSSFFPHVCPPPMSEGLLATSTVCVRGKNCAKSSLLERSDFLSAGPNTFSGFFVVVDESSSYEGLESNKNHCWCRILRARVLPLSVCTVA